MDETIRYCEDGGGSNVTDQTPEPLCAQYDKPDKASAIKAHRSRFST